VKLQSIKTETGYSTNVTTAICEDEDGELWFKQSRLGIYLFDTKTARTRRISSVPGVNAIGRCSKQGEIWVAADYVPNIYRFRKANGKVLLTETIELRAILGENTQVVKFLLEDRNGIVWVATHDALLSYRQDQWQIACNDCGTITGIAEDSYGAIWIGTAEKGLLQVIPGNDKPSTKSYNTNTCRIAGNNISCISAGTDGQLWFCVNETRLCNYDITKQQFTDYAQRANASNFVILNIVAGDNERIWISGSKQVVEFNTRTGASIQYDAQKDLTVTSLNKNAVAKRNDGSIVFGGNKGLCIFTPSPQLNLPCKKVKPLITDVKINGKTVYQRDINRQNPDWQKRLILLPAETNIEIDFSSFNYLNPGKIRYAYKLEGVDEQWIYPEPGRNFAVYNQLRKGEYTFLVKSTGDNQLWSNEITPMLVVKKPAFYETGRAYVLYAIVILFILVAVSRLYANRIKLLGELHITQLDKKKQEELIQTKLRFFTNIGHEFRTPLTLIMTPLRTLIGQLTDDKLKQKLSSIYRNAEDMLGLINQLLDFRKLEMDGENLKLSCNDFVKFTHYVYSAFKDIAGNKSIQFTFESDVRQLFMFFDKNKVRKIINNLYSNALKFTSEEGYIATFIRLVQENEREFVCVDIADSGCGIPEKDRQMIFKRFYQSENNDSESTGSGIGLHLAKEYVELHGGQIKVDSEVGKGSVFSIFIPVDLQVIYDNTEKEDPHPESLPVSPETDINRNQEQKTLLIVEDNLELRHFLAEQLGDRFNALQAADGKEGLAAARKKSPDLIVSDLMMPGLNGLEMCRQLKTDIQTSHIPIILLTAKLSDETKIESYKAGADSHIAKPFNFEVLLTRIETLIEQQEKRKKLFHKTIEITPGSITTSSLDEELIKKALLVVEKNMDNSEFSVDELASELAFSRRQLSRKFQSIIGLSPGEFIHSVRLKRAAQLLKDSQYNISEISDRTGFGNIKYFNRYFKEEFGVTPTQYRLENRK
ncbi:MAG: response regulator, partial [Dysgonamonadaceae bacterium]|nr:response regulator [Dysgonamonadaceae bacterium]